MRRYSTGDTKLAWAGYSAPAEGASSTTVVLGDATVKA